VSHDNKTNMNFGASGNGEICNISDHCPKLSNQYL